MPKKISETELDQIVAAVGKFPSGASINDIVGTFDNRLPRRTTQRHLALLTAGSRLVRLGRGPATRYSLPSRHIELRDRPLESAERPSAANLELRIPVSEESGRIRDAVRQPVQSRQPVGYNRAFLDDYRPNKTFYLPSDVRVRLREIGTLTNDDRLAVFRGSTHPASGEVPALPYASAVGETPPAEGSYGRRVLDRLLIDLSWNSSRLEGNTYSLLETERLLQLGELVDGKDARDAQMILNHKSAIELLVDNSIEVRFDRYTILSLHALLSDNLLPNPDACGRLRHISVAIGGTVFYPLDVPQLVDECFNQILDKAAVIEDPFEQSFFVLVHLPYLQPFEDVNKRVSRLAANLPFVRLALSPLSFVDVTQRAYVDAMLAVYELNRTELLRDVYVWAYERSCARYSAIRQVLGQPDPFRLRYRGLIRETVANVVRGNMNKVAANVHIDAQASEELPVAHQARFREVSATELMGLHEGKIAVYGLRPAEFEGWKKTWV